MKRSAHPEGRSHREAEAESNLVAEFEMKPLQPSSFILHTSYAWGYDLSATEQGAGGVGGLLFAKTHSTTAQPSSALQAPAYDGNGNITAYLEVTTGQVMSRHEYDAFGNELSVDSLLVSSPSSIPNPPSSPFKFSTKYIDPETALCYYGYRYMSPELGRWLNRDPIGELGGLNLYVAIDNAAINNIDRLGHSTALTWGARVCPCAVADGPLPIGEIFVAAVMTAGAVIDIYEWCTAEEEVKKKRCTVVATFINGMQPGMPMLGFPGIKVCVYNCGNKVEYAFADDGKCPDMEYTPTKDNP